MRITQAPIGWNNINNFLTNKESIEMLHASVSIEQRQLAIRKFMIDYMLYTKTEIKEFLLTKIKEYLLVIPEFGVPAYNKKEAVWLAHLDLLNAAAWEEENEELIIEF